MAIPDFVNETLSILDTNWNTSNASKPTLIDGDSMIDHPDGNRTRGVEVLSENVLTVDSSPPATIEAAGVGYDTLDIRYGVGIQVEGYHADGGGEVADKDEFDSIVGEARRALYEDRKRPFDDITTMFIETERDESPTQPQDADYFRYEFDVWYEGYDFDPA